MSDPLTSEEAKVEKDLAEGKAAVLEGKGWWAQNRTEAITIMAIAFLIGLIAGTFLCHMRHHF